MNYLGLDTETGGIGMQYSLLTAGFVVTDEKLNPIDELILSYKYTQKGRSIYSIDPGGMAVNKIDLAEHDKIALSVEENAVLLKKFLVKHSVVQFYVPGQDEWIDKTYHLVPIGQNLVFDLERVKEVFPEWDYYVSYRFIDTMVLGRFFIDVGIFEPDASISLRALTGRFNINHDKAHTALGDTYSTLAVYGEMKKLV